MPKRYNTPHRNRVVKTRLTEEEYRELSGRLEDYGMSLSEFLRQCLTRTAVKPVITVSPVNDALLEQLGKLMAEYGRIGGNLNQIARFLNRYGQPYPKLAAEVQGAAAELSSLKFQVLKEVGDALGHTETYRL